MAAPRKSTASRASRDEDGGAASSAADRFWFITGTDETAVKERALQLSLKLVKEHTAGDEWSLETVDGWVDSVDACVEVLGRVRETLQTVGFFAAARVVWLKNASCLADDYSGSESVVDAVERLLEVVRNGLPEDMYLLISAPNADKRRAIYKEISKLASSTVLDALPSTGFGSEKGQAAAEDLVERLFREAGKRAASGAAERLIELCGGDTRIVHMEAQKALLYAGAESTVTIDHIEQIVAPTREQSLWDWCDAVMEGKTQRALDLLRSLETQRENAVGLIINLSNSARLAVQCSALIEQRWLTPLGYGKVKYTAEAEALLPRTKEGKISTFRVGKIASQVERKPLAYWLAFFDVVYEAFATLFETGADHYDRLEHLTLKLHAIELSR